MFGHVATPEVQPLDNAVGSLAASVDALDLAGMDDRRAAAVLVELRRVTARLAAVQARLIDGVDTARPWAEDGYRTTANWLATSDHTSMDAARADVLLARRLRTMPATRRALEAGDITAAHAHKLASLNGPSTAAAFAEAEAFLVGQARTMRWADFAKTCAHWLRLARDDDPDPEKRDRDLRHVSLHDGLRGTGLLEGELIPVAKATVRSALERLEHELFEADWAAARAEHGDAATLADLDRTPRQRRHDALVEMAKRAVAAPADGKRPRPLVTVLVGYDAFHDMCELADGTLISPAAGASLLDEAVVERIVFDADGRVLDLGQQRSFVGAARRAVEVTDRHCTGPGCDRPGHRCDVDHIWRYADGGPTRPDNGQLKCGHHNRQRERPPPLRRRPAVPVGDPEAHLELLRSRIRDRLQHDPTWLTPTPV